MSDLDDFEDDDYLDFDDDYDEEDEWIEAESNCRVLQRVESQKQSQARGGR